VKDLESFNADFAIFIVSARNKALIAEKNRLR
jgi:hypothetical protein